MSSDEEFIAASAWLLLTYPEFHAQIKFRLRLIYTAFDKCKDGDEWYELEHEKLELRGAVLSMYKYRTFL